MTFFETLNELIASGIPVVAVTVVDTIGSAPQDRGAKMIVTGKGLHCGTVGGGKIETRAIDEAAAMLRDPACGATRFVQWNLNRDIGMTCGGSVKLYFESYNVATWKIVIFGAGHVSQALTSLLLHLDCQVTCIDPRPEWLSRLPSSSRLTKIQSSDMKLEVSSLPDDAFVTLMTMGHSTDSPILLEILRTRRFPYLGVIGSRAKAHRLRKDVAEAGLSEDLQRAFHCPIGLELGSNHPYEIAVSVIAQFLKVRDEVRAGSAVPKESVSAE